MKTMDSTANEDIIAGLTKSPEGGYTGKYSPAADMTGYLRAVDKAGNWNDPATSLPVIFKTDFAAPVIGEVKQEANGMNVRVSVDITDEKSGMSRAYLTQDLNTEDGIALVKGTDGNLYSALLTENGDWYVIAYDVAGNRSVSPAFTVDGIDREPPVITNIMVNADRTISATVTDALSGVGVVYLSEDKDAETGMVMARQEDTDTYISAKVEEGKTYYVTAYDKAGNRAAAEVTVTNADKTAPVVTASQSPEDPAKSKIIVAVANDPAGPSGEPVSGIDSSRVYLLTDNDEAAADGTPLTLQDDGTYHSPALAQAGTYYVFCYDKAGNRSKNAAVTVDGIITGGGTPIGPSGTGGIDAYYQGGDYPGGAVSAAEMDSTKALVWMGDTLFRTMEPGAYLAEDLIGTTKFNDRTSTAYAGSLLLTEMERFAGTVADTPGLKTIDLPDVGAEGQTAFPLHHGPSGTDTTGSELENTAYFPQGNTSRNAGLTSSPTTGLTWWTRTGYKTTSRVWTANQIGQMQNYVVTGTYGIRPEVYLDHTQALFVPAADGGGAPEANTKLVRSMGAFKSNSANETRIWNAGAQIGNAQTYRVFRLDGTDAVLQPDKTTAAAATSDGSMVIRYEGASYGENNYMSVMLVNKTTHEKWSGRIGKISSADGEQNLVLPKVNGKSVIGDPDYLLFVWNENETGQNACSPLRFEMGNLVLPSNPEIMRITQQPEGWTGADAEKTITAEVKFADTAIQKKVEISQNADGSGEKYALSENADGTYSTAEVKTGGIWYVTATDETSGLTAMKPVGIKIDTTPPDITYAALGRNNRIQAMAEDAQSGMGSMYWSANADGSEAKEMALQDGAYTSGEITELGTYYVYAVDAVGNASEALPVEVTQLFDTTPPDISNITYEQQADGSWKVAFTVEDTPRLPEPATGVDPSTVQWKKGMGGAYVPAVQDTSFADGNHYYFLTDGSIEDTIHYIYAEDYAGNAVEKEAVNQSGVISVSVPTKMLFAALPNVAGEKFFAPEYTVRNNSETNKLNVSLVGFEADDSSKGFELAAPGTQLGKNQMTLYLSGIENDAGGFAGLPRIALMPGAFDEENAVELGKLAKKTAAGAANENGKYTFAGDIPEFDLMELRTLEAMRAKFNMTLLFEKDYTG